MDYYLTHSEPEDGPSRRLRFNFKDGTYSILLLDKQYLFLARRICEVPSGTEFADFMKPLGNSVSGMGSSVLNTICMQLPQLDTNEKVYIDELPEETPKIPKSWHVLYDIGQNALVLYTNASQAPKILIRKPNDMGYIITGKENISKPIIRVNMVAKHDPTPFIADKWGDSYNDSFDLEPRVVVDAPSTVFKVETDILEYAKKAYCVGEFEVAAEKYRKAFHYCHKFYPDDLSESDLKTATDLKIRILLNLAMASVQCGSTEWFKRAIESVNLLLGMPEVTNDDRAKALYRRGVAELRLKDTITAQADFEASLALIDDPATRNALEECNTAEQSRQSQLRSNIRKGFFN